jgi:hypothetical protein
VADFAYSKGYYIEGTGTSWDLMEEGAKHYGLSPKTLEIDRESITSSLKGNMPIIASMKPGTFTDVGHFLVLSGLDSKGGIKVLDPNSIANTKKPWGFDVFEQEARALWAYGYYE